MTEQIYNDFITKLLPKIQEGLTITYQYFTDLFGRYIDYLIFVDSLRTIIGFIIVLATIISLVLLIKHGRKNDWDEEYAFVALLIFPLGIGIIIFFSGITNLAQDIYVPEIRVYEKLSDIISNN